MDYYNFLKKEYINHKNIKIYKNEDKIIINDYPIYKSSGILWPYEFENGIYRLDFKIKSYTPNSYFIYCENTTDKLIDRIYIYNTTTNQHIKFTSKAGLYNIGILLWDSNKLYDLEIHKFKIRKENFGTTNIIKNKNSNKNKKIIKITKITKNEKNKYIGKQIVTNISEVITDIETSNKLTKNKLQQGLSFLIRAKNEDENIKDCIESLLSIENDIDEIIFIDNNSTDKTLSIIKEYEKKYYKKIKVYQYKINIPSTGIEHETAIINNSKNTISTYYNWGLSKVTKNNIVKWDADFIAIKNNLKTMIQQYNLRKRKDKFCVWFTGQVIYHKKYIKYKSNYNEFRIFSKLHGFKWKNYIKCETSGFYVRNCDICIINGFPTKIDMQNNKNENLIKKEQQKSPIIFLEKKGINDYKAENIIIDQRDVEDNRNLLVTNKLINENKILNETLQNNKIDFNIKVLITLPGLGLGGGNYWFLNLYKILNKIGIRMYVYLNNDNGIFYDDLTNITIVNYKMTSEELTSYIIKNKITYVIESTPKLNKKCLEELYNKISLYVITHSDISYINEYICSNKMYIKKIICINNTTVSKFIKNNIYNVSLLKNYLPYDTITHQPIKTTYNIGFVSRLSKDKNIILLLYAIKRILESNKNIILHIIGTDTEKMNKTINYYINHLKLESKVINHGLQKQHKVKELYSMIDICVLPSINEGMSYNLMECILYEIPLVVTNTNSNIELLENSAEYFTIKNNNELLNDTISINNYDNLITNVGYINTTSKLDLELYTSDILKLSQNDNFEENIISLKKSIINVINNYNNYKEKISILKKIKNKEYFSEERYINDLFKIFEINKNIEFI